VLVLPLLMLTGEATSLTAEYSHRGIAFKSPLVFQANHLSRPEHVAFRQIASEDPHFGVI
jgi:hypothetical protein